MIGGIDGHLGQGKTLTLTALGYYYKKKHDAFVVTNYDIDYANEKVTSTVQIDDISQEHVGVMLLDEIWAWADSRESANNDVMNTFVINSRKRGWKVFWTAQKYHMVDKRLRHNTDFHIECRHIENVHKPDMLKIIIIDTMTGQPVNQIMVNAEVFYDMYDTTEEVNNNKEREQDMLERVQEQVDLSDFDTKKSLRSHIYLNFKQISKSNADMIADELMRQHEMEGEV